MSLQTILIYAVLSTFNLIFAACIENPFAESKLPKEMPEKTSFRYSENAGMAPAWYRVEVKGKILSVEDKNMQQDKAVMWYAEISNADKAAVYKIFVDNKFDLIENEKRKGTVYDAGSEGVYIRAGKVSKNVSYGANSPLSRKNGAKWRAAANAIKTLAKKYETKGKKIPENYAVISFNSQRHKFIFKDVGHRNLELPDIDKTRKIVEKAVEEYKKKHTKKAKLSDSAEYKFQLVSAANSKNETIVWVNAVCNADNSWRRRIITVYDGGNCFFNLYVNLTKETYNRFSVNGDG